MQIPYDPLEFYAQILRNEIRSADAKVGIAVASSSILLSANFLMLRAGTLSPVPSAFVLLATATALAAVVFAILAVRPGVSSQSKGFFITRTCTAEDQRSCWSGSATRKRSMRNWRCSVPTMPVSPSASTSSCASR